MVQPARRSAGGDPEFVAWSLAPCAVCGRDNRGWGRSIDGKLTYRYCGRACSEAHERIGFAVIDKTAREGRAIKAARKPFAEALTELGLMQYFFGLEPQQIDQLIEAAVGGYVDSMAGQAGVKERGLDFNDEIPF